MTENKTRVRKNLIGKDFVMTVHLDFIAGKGKSNSFVR